MAEEYADFFPCNYGVIIVGQTAQNNTDAGNSGGDTSTQRKNWCYIGPTIPGGRLSSNATLRGTRAEVEDSLAQITQSYPEAIYLVIDTENLAIAQRDLKATNSFLWSCYKQTEARIKAAQSK